MTGTAFYEAVNEIVSVAARLRYLANSFADTGNEAVARRLDGMADELGDARTAAAGAYEELLDSSLAHSKSTAGALLAAVASGCLRPPAREDR